MKSFNGKIKSSKMKTLLSLFTITCILLLFYGKLIPIEAAQLEPTVNISVPIQEIEIRGKNGSVKYYHSYNIEKIIMHTNGLCEVYTKVEAYKENNEDNITVYYKRFLYTSDGFPVGEELVHPGVEIEINGGSYPSCEIYPFSFWSEKEEIIFNYDKEGTLKKVEGNRIYLNDKQYIDLELKDNKVSMVKMCDESGKVIAEEHYNSYGQPTLRKMNYSKGYLHSISYQYQLLSCGIPQKKTTGAEKNISFSVIKTMNRTVKIKKEHLNTTHYTYEQTVKREGGLYEVRSKAKDGEVIRQLYTSDGVFLAYQTDHERTIPYFEATEGGDIPFEGKNGETRSIINCYEDGKRYELEFTDSKGKNLKKYSKDSILIKELFVNPDGTIAARYIYDNEGNLSTRDEFVFETISP